MKIDKQKLIQRKIVQNKKKKINSMLLIMGMTNKHKSFR